MAEPSFSTDVLKRHLDIVDVCRRVGIEPTGHHAGSALIAWPCPCGHDSKSGNCFHILPDRQAVKCHNCGFSGDVFHVVGQARFGHKEAFKEAVDWLCNEYRLESPWRNMTTEEREQHEAKRKEAERMHAIFKTASQFWHENTPPEIFGVLQKNYGITRQTADSLRIGYASGEGLFRHLKGQGFTGAELNRSGLFNGDHLQYEFFKRRIIFPYWHYDSIVYLIARKAEEGIGAPPVLWTVQEGEEEQYEKAKYKKLRVHDDGKNSHISTAIRNDHLYGASCPPGDVLLITEGVTDCISANQAGITCISPVTVRFRKEDNERLLHQARRFKRVYVCNDNEANKAGEGGALDTLSFLAGQGINAYLITLPRSDGKDKIDLCEYLRDQGGEAFLKLMKQSPHIIEAVTNRVDPDLPPIEKIRTLQAQGVFGWMANMGNMECTYHLDAIKSVFGCKKSLLQEAIKEANAEKKKPQQSDLAESFVETHKCYAYHSQFKQWMKYHAGVWRRIEPEMMQAAVQRHLKEEVGSYTAQTLNGVLSMLKGFLGESEAKWDDSKRLIPFVNGVLDTETMTLHPHSPEYRFTWQLPYPYDLQAPAPMKILTWLKDTMKGDVQNVAVLLAYLAAILRGRTDLQRFLECDGPPGAGKGTYLRLAEQMVGAANTFTTTLSDLENKNNRFTTSRIIGKRLVLITDSERFAGEATMLRALTGEDNLPFDIKGVHVWEGGFRPQAMVVVAANEAVQTSDYAGAIDRRRLPIQFNNHVKNKEQRNLEDEFLPEMPGLLNLVLSITDEEIRAFVKNTELLSGFASTKADVLVSTNHLAAWAHSNLIYATKSSARIGDAKRNQDRELQRSYHNEEDWLYPNYRAYCEQNGHTRPFASNKFSENLRSLLVTQLDLGDVEYYPKKSSTNGYEPAHFKGVRLRSGDEQGMSPLDFYAKDAKATEPIPTQTYSQPTFIQQYTLLNSLLSLFSGTHSEEKKETPPPDPAPVKNEVFPIESILPESGKSELSTVYQKEKVGTELVKVGIGKQAPSTSNKGNGSKGKADFIGAGVVKGSYQQTEVRRRETWVIFPPDEISGDTLSVVSAVSAVPATTENKNEKNYRQAEDPCLQLSAVPPNEPLHPIQEKGAAKVATVATENININKNNQLNIERETATVATVFKNPPPPEHDPKNGSLLLSGKKDIEL